MSYSKAVTDSILIMAAGTRADTLRLASGERIGGLWCFKSIDSSAATLAEARRVLKAHGMHMVQAPAPQGARKRYGVRKAYLIRENMAHPDAN
jgi:hypothetical protein